MAALGQALARSASVGAKVGVKSALRNIFTYLISAELGRADLGEIWGRYTGDVERDVGEM